MSKQLQSKVLDSKLPDEKKVDQSYNNLFKAFQQAVLQQSKTEDESDVSSTTSLSTGDQKGRKGGQLVGSSQKGLSQSASLDQALASMVSSPDAITLLRAELLKERTRIPSSINNYKHYYNLGALTVSQVESTQPLFDITQGSGISNRLTNDCRIRKGIFRIRLVRTTTGPGTTAFVPPTITFFIGRSKVPPSLGAVPTIFATGTNPPSSANVLYSGLGTFNVPSLQVVNPAVVDMYHMYHIIHHQFGTEDVQYTTPASAYAIQPSRTHVYEIDIDFHHLEQSFASASSQYSVINQLFIGCRSDESYTNQGFSDVMQYTVDFEFEDVQDG